MESIKGKVQRCCQRSYLCKGSKHSLTYHINSRSNNCIGLFLITSVHFSAGATLADSPGHVVESCKITFAMLANPDAALSVVFGNGGVLSAISCGKRLFATQFQLIAGIKHWRLRIAHKIKAKVADWALILLPATSTAALLTIPVLNASPLLSLLQEANFSKPQSVAGAICEYLQHVNAYSILTSQK